MPIPYYPGSLVTPNLGLSLVGMDVEVAENFVILDAAVGGGGGGGSTVRVNGTPITNPNFNDITPAAPVGNVNVTFQVSGGNVSAYVPSSTGNLTGTLTPGIIPVATGVNTLGDGSLADNAAGTLTRTGTLFIQAIDGHMFLSTINGGSFSGNINFSSASGIVGSANTGVQFESVAGGVELIADADDVQLVAQTGTVTATPIKVTGAGRNTVLGFGTLVDLVQEDTDWGIVLRSAEDPVDRGFVWYVDDVGTLNMAATESDGSNVNTMVFRSLAQGGNILIGPAPGFGLVVTPFSGTPPSVIVGGGYLLRVDSLTASEPVFSDASKNLVSGTLSGNTTKLVTESGSIASGHIFVADANGNAVDGGTVSLVVASINQTGQTASIATANIVASATAAVYRLDYYLKITTAGSTSGSVTLTLSYTDRDDSQVITFVVPTPANAVDSTGVVSGVLILDAKVATAITYATTYASSGGTAMQYKLRIKAEAL